jgi:hypothetical protein
VDAAILLLFSFAALASLRPLTYVASQITADAPAICLMALSVLVLYIRFDRPTFVTAASSSLLLILSIGCKQNMAIAGAVLGIAICWFFPRSFAALYAVLLAGASALVVAFTAFTYHGLKAIYYNDVIIPKEWPFQRSLIPGGASIFLDACALIALTMIGTVLIARRCREAALCTVALVHFHLLPNRLCVGAIRPDHLCGMGGDANSFAHAVYFLLLGAVLTSFELISGCDRDSRFIETLRVWLAVAALAMLATSTRVQYRHSIPDLFRRTTSAVQAYNYCSHNAGKVYFPANSVAAYLAERTFYYTYWGVMILVEAHQPLSRAEVLRYIPPRAQYIAVPQVHDPAYEPLLTFVAPHRIAASIAGLSDFNVFEIERSI